MADQKPARILTRRDILAVVLLAVVVTGFLFPLVARWWPSVFDDCPILELPGLIKTARIVQSGALPLWDDSTFAGAKPLYVDNAYLIFYPLMYPFFMLANVNDFDQSHTVLMLIPLLLHLVSAAVGSYLFGRCVLHIQPLAAWVMALVYSLSPDMGFQLVSCSIAITLSYLPWCCLALARFMETGRPSWWLGGTLTLALMCSTGNPNYLVRAYFMLSVVVGLLWLLQIVGLLRRVPVDVREPSPGWRSVMVRFAAAVVMFPLGIALTGFAWGGTLEAVHWIEDTIRLTPQSTASYFRYSSMFPLNVVTMFVPGFFGDLDPPHTWGVGQLLSNHSTLCGGMFLTFAVFVAVAAGRRSQTERKTAHGQSADNMIIRNDAAAAQRWTSIALILLVGSLLTMMGGFTPFFAAACTILPWFFEFPHPVYYRFVTCWSFALLVGIGLSAILRQSDNVRRPSRWFPVAVSCIAFAAVGMAIGLLWGFDGSWFSMAGYATLTSQDDWSWFLGGPGLYFTVASVILLIITWVPKPRLLGWCVVAGTILEITFVAWVLFYKTEHLGLQTAADRNASPGRYRSATQYPHVQPIVKIMRELLSDGQYRCVSQNSRLDNQAWYVDGRALLGYSGKPLIPAYASMVSRFAGGKLALQLKEYPAQLLRNMNVRYQIVPHNDRDTDQLQVAEPVADAPQPSGSRIMREAGFDVFELPDPLPYAYVQDRIVHCPQSEQLDLLMSADLRSAVLIDSIQTDGLPGDLSHVSDTLDRLIESEPGPRFARLQRSNPIKSVVRPRGNELRIDVRLEQPAMLVINECWHPGWHARIDGRPVPVRRVNFLQQGIWLESGSHQVNLTFFPASVRNGCMAMLLSWILFAGLAVVVMIRARSHE